MKAKMPAAPVNRMMRVLVVDDDDTFQLVIQNRLKASGHVVDSAADAETAVERLARRTFDVMLLDLSMPGMGGLELLRRLSQNGLPCEIVVVQVPGLGHLVEQHDTAERRRQCGDEQPVITTGRDAADRPGCVAAEPVGDEPLARQDFLARLGVEPRELDAPDGRLHRQVFGGTGRSTSAACPGSRHGPSGSNSAVPHPP